MDLDKTEPEKEVEVPEPEFQILNNPARVTPLQFPLISFDVDARYVPIISEHGIVLLKDTKPQEKEELLEANTSAASVAGSDDEPAPPESFQFLG